MIKSSDYKEVLDRGVFPGIYEPHSHSDDVESKTVKGTTLQSDTITVDTATADVTYSITLGTDDPETVSVVATGVDTTATIAAKLLTEIEANAVFGNAVDVTLAGAVLTFTARPLNYTYNLSTATAEMTLANVATGSSNVEIPAGAGVVADGFDGVALPSAGEALEGIAVHTHKPPAADGTPSPYITGEVCPVMRHGKIAVLVEDSPVKGDAVFMRVAAGAGGTQLGAFRTDADGGSAEAVPAARAEWASEAQVGLCGSRYAWLRIHY